MVHNGIEYGLMAAYAEGLNVLHHANIGKTAMERTRRLPRLGDAELLPLDFDMRRIAEVWPARERVSPPGFGPDRDRAAESPSSRSSADACPIPARGAGPWPLRSTRGFRRMCSARPCLAALPRAAKPTTATSCSPRCERNSVATRKSPPQECDATLFCAIPRAVAALGSGWARWR